MMMSGKQHSLDSRIDLAQVNIHNIVIFFFHYWRAVAFLIFCLPPSLMAAAYSQVLSQAAVLLRHEGLP
jgi:hypothetical protein